MTIDSLGKFHYWKFIQIKIPNITNYINHSVSNNYVSSRSLSMISSTIFFEIVGTLSSKESKYLLINTINERLLRRLLTTILKRMFEIRKEKKVNIDEFILSILFRSWSMLSFLEGSDDLKEVPSTHHHGDIVEEK